MAKLLRLRRGTTSDHSSFTGAEGEVTVDTTKDTLVVHDGSTQGGVPLAKTSDLNVDNISEGDSKVEVTDSGTNGKVEIKTNNILQLSVDDAGSGTHRGRVNLWGTSTTGEGGAVRFYAGGNSYYTELKNNSSSLSANYSYTVPLGTPASKKILQSTSSGSMSWSNNIESDLKYADDIKATFGTNNDADVYHNDTDFYIDNDKGDVKIRANVAADVGGDIHLMPHDDEEGIKIIHDAAVELYHNGTKKFETSATGGTLTGTLVVDNLDIGTDVDVDGTLETDAITVSGTADFTGQMSEAVTVTAGKMSDNTNIDLANGNVFLFTTAESTTCTPNIRYDGSNALNTKMGVGDAITVTLITTANASAFSAHITIDGSAVTENWVGGSAPDAGGSSGVDIHSFTIVKTASATFTVIGNHSKTS